MRHARSYTMNTRTCDHWQIGEVVLHLATAGYTTGLDYLCTGGAELGYAPRKVAS